MQKDFYKFHVLLNFLSINGTIASKLTRTIDTSIRDCLDLLFKGDKISHTCFAAGPFVLLLFGGITKNIAANPGRDLMNPRNFSIIEEITVDNRILDKMGKAWESFLGSFQPMTVTEFSLPDHETVLAYINEYEIYLIDFFMESNRDQWFRVKKFKDVHDALDQIYNVMFAQSRRSYMKLFGFQKGATCYQESYKGYLTFQMCEIIELPTLDKLILLWNRSLDLFLYDIDLLFSTNPMKKTELTYSQVIDVNIREDYQILDNNDWEQLRKIKNRASFEKKYQELIKRRFEESYRNAIKSLFI
jgi:hypothetical protein